MQILKIVTAQPNVPYTSAAHGTHLAHPGDAVRSSALCFSRCADTQVLGLPERFAEASAPLTWARRSTHDLCTPTELRQDRSACPYNHKLCTSSKEAPPIASHYRILRKTPARKASWRRP